MHQSMHSDEFLPLYLFEGLDPNLYLPPNFQIPPSPSTTAITDHMDTIQFTFPELCDLFSSPDLTMNNLPFPFPVPETTLEPMSGFIYPFAPDCSPATSVGDLGSPLSAGSTFDLIVASEDDVPFKLEPKLEFTVPAPLDSTARRSRLPKFVCRFCSKVLYTKNRRQHALTHEDGKPTYACLHPSCTKAYTRPNDMHRHMRSAHAGRSSASCSGPKRRKPRPCDACRRPKFGDDSCECGYTAML